MSEEGRIERKGREEGKTERKEECRGRKNVEK